jgi:6-pyruvoyltetrahydropterin/6-carboxytetrahydropterin synthase
LKKWINTYIDHQFIIDKNDPLFEHLIGSNAPTIPVVITGTDVVDVVAGYQLDLEAFDPTTAPHLLEMFEGFLIVDFVPTSENLSEWMAKLVDVKMRNLNVTVDRIDWWETPKSRSTFINS